MAKSTVLQVFVAVFVMLWLGLSSLTGGPYKQPLDLDTSGSLVLTNWSATVAFSGLVLYPLLYRGQVPSAPGISRLLPALI